MAFESQVKYVLFNLVFTKRFNIRHDAFIDKSVSWTVSNTTQTHQQVGFSVEIHQLLQQMRVQCLVRQ